MHRISHSSQCSVRVLSPCRSFSRFFSLLSTRSLLLALWTAPNFFTFLPLYSGIFSMLPRSVLAKSTASAGDDADEGAAEADAEGGAMNERQRVLQGGVEALLDGEITLSAPASLTAPQPLLLSKRAIRKRKQAERNAHKGAFEEDNTFNARNNAAQTDEEPRGKRHDSEALKELRRITGADTASAQSRVEQATAAAAAPFSAGPGAFPAPASSAPPPVAPAGSSVPRRARRARQDE